VLTAISVSPAALAVTVTPATGLPKCVTVPEIVATTLSASFVELLSVPRELVPVTLEAMDPSPGVDAVTENEKLFEPPAASERPEVNEVASSPELDFSPVKSR
jgi:hypothetical protein